MFYEDNRVKKSAPYACNIWDDPNEYMEDNMLRRRENSRRKEKLKTYLEALHDVGCRQGVFEIHLEPVYADEKWKKYLEMSKRNVESVINKF